MLIFSVHEKNHNKGNKNLGHRTNQDYMRNNKLISEKIITTKEEQINQILYTFIKKLKNLFYKFQKIWK
jgi:hypothetical protein